MAVTSLLTTIQDFEGTPTFVSYGGGQGATVNTDIFIQGAQSAGRRVDAAVDSGFGVTITPAVDLSAAGVHVKVWLFVTQWAAVTQVQVRISSGADDDHNLPTNEFPSLGGFIPVWVDVSRTPEVGGTANEASINEIGVLLDIGNVGGNAQNLILDEIHHGTSGLRWDGSSGTFGSFRTFESTNNEGNLVTLNGVDFVYSRLEIGSATATSFTDSGFTIIFPDQALVASTFMGLTFDLQNASTSISLSNATVQTSEPATATNRPDLIVTGTSGSLSLTNMSFIGLRTATLTSAVTISGGIYELLDLTQSSASISDAIFRPRTASGVAMCNDPNFSNLSGVTFTQAGSGHALEITSPGTYSFDALFFNGFGGTPGSNGTANSGANDAAIYNNSGGAVTINIINGGDTPSVRNGAGATTTVNNTVTVRVTVTDTAGTPIQNARVYLVAAAGGDLSAGTEILTGLTNASGVVENTGFAYTNPQPVTGRARQGTTQPYYKTGNIVGSIQSNGFETTVQLVLDQ